MAHLRNAGCVEVPPVLASTIGDTLVADGQGRIWEGVGFVAGSATDRPSTAQAQAAARVVARVHQAAATWPAAPSRIAVPAAVTRRIEQARRMLTEPWEQGVFAGHQATGWQAEVAARKGLAAAIARDSELDAILRGIAVLQPPPVAVQAVIRDLRADHVLYDRAEFDRVAGLVDFQAAAVDTPATDLARLLGSWRHQPAIGRSDASRAALEAYATQRPLSARERRLVGWLDATATVFSLDNWFRWVLAEGRRFEQPVQVVERIDRLLEALPEAVAWLRDDPGHV